MAAAEDEGAGLADDFSPKDPVSPAFWIPDRKDSRLYPRRRAEMLQHSAGYRLAQLPFHPPVAASDNHCPDLVGRGTVDFDSFLSAAGSALPSLQYL